MEESIELFRILLTKLTEKQFEIIMTDNNYIKRNFKLIKLSEQRLIKINKLIEEIKEINENQIPQEILDLHNIRSTRNQDQQYFEYLCKKAEMEKLILNKYKKKLIKNLNLTG